MKIKQKMEKIVSNQKRKFLSFPRKVTVLAMLVALPAGLGTFGTLEEHHGCTMILVGKDATADGSVLMSYNNDWDGKGASHVVVVPRKTYEPGAMYKLSNGVEIPQPA